MEGHYGDSAEIRHSPSASLTNAILLSVRLISQTYPGPWGQP